MGLGHGLGHQELGLMTSSMSLGGLGGVLVWGHVDLATRDCVHHGGLGVDLATHEFVHHGDLGVDQATRGRSYRYPL